MGTELEWSLRDVGDRIDRLIARVAHRLGEVAGLSVDGYSAALSGMSALPPNGQAQSLSLMPADAALQRVVGALDRLGSELDSGTGKLRAELLDALDASLSGAELDALGSRRSVRSPVAQARRVGEAVGLFLRRMFRFSRVLVRQPAVLVSRVRNSAMVRDVALLEGEQRYDPHHMRAEVLQLAPSPSHTAGLPYLLRRFFAPGALSDLGGSPVAADAAVESIQGAWQRFVEGEPVSILLSGPEGSGKSSVAQSTLRATRIPTLFAWSWDLAAGQKRSYHGLLVPQSVPSAWVVLMRWRRRYFANRSGCSCWTHSRNCFLGLLRG